MAAGPHARVGGLSSIALIAAVGLLAAACSGDDPQVAAGADTSRSGVASMDDVVFTDVASEVGLDFRHSAFRWETGPDPVAMMGGGVCWIDYDSDGWLDLFVVDTWSNGEWGEWRSGDGIPTSRLYRNDAGRFTDVTEKTAAGYPLRGNGCVAADLDLDGWTDLFVTTEREDVLLWNDGGDGFIDDAELPTPSGAATFGWHTGTAVGDLDGNGWPDLFVAGYADMNRPITSATKGFPNTHQPERDLLFLNDGPGDGRRVRFRDVAAEVGLEPDGADYGLGVRLGDLDLDGDLDAYVAHDTSPNQLYDNIADESPAGFRMVERGVEAGVGDEGAGMGVAADDADGDRLPDLVTTNQLAERNLVLRNTTVGPITFVDAGDAVGVADFGVGSTGWGTSWADIDLDADLDLLVANGAIPVRDLADDRQQLALLENRLTEQGRLVDASADVGLEGLGPYLARGLAAADYDNDGDIDLAVGTIGGELALLRNTGAGGNWLTVAFPTPVPGAVVTALLSDGTVLRRELAAGSSYLSSEDPRAHFGLGAHDQGEELLIGLPDGSEIRLTDVEAGQLLEIDPDDRR